MSRFVVLVLVALVIVGAWLAWRWYRSGQTMLEVGVDPGAPSEDRIGPLANDPARRTEFLRAVMEQGITIASTVPEDGQVQWPDYEENGEYIFPVFSSAEIASEFLGRRLEGRLRDEVASFAVMTVGPEFLWTNDWSGTRLVLNPGHEWTTTLSEEDIAELERLSSDTP